MKIRLDRYISNNSNYSRKETHNIIRKQKVYVNNEYINDPKHKINTDDAVKVNDVLIENSKTYLAFNKPKGYICSNTSNRDGISIFELIPDYDPNKFHIIGRLDKDTTGLLVITNDGDFTHFIKKPNSNIEKEYEVELEKELTNDMLNIISKPITFDNKILKPFIIKNVNHNKLNIILVEGKYHQIKRIFQICNNKVIKLNRIRIANLYLNDLNISLGQYKKITKNDIIK